MSTTTNDGSPLGVLGVFLVMLGAGVVLDGDWWMPGGALMAAGICCMSAQSDPAGKGEAGPR